MSKPKEYRVCAICGAKLHKSQLLRISFPDLTFDFWQNLEGRGFYVCANYKCINRVLKKKSVNKYLDNYKDLSLLPGILKNNIKEGLIYNINMLFNKHSSHIKDNNSSYLALCRYDSDFDFENKITIPKEIYNGEKDISIIYNKNIIKRLTNYQNLLRNPNGLLYGELDGSKKS